MKKLCLITALLLGAFALFARATSDIHKREVTVTPFDKLSVAANVTVILYESADLLTVIVQGKENHARKVAILQKDSKLLVTSPGGVDLKEKVTVYIPVNKLRSLEVSEDAIVRSQNILQSPGLELQSDGLGEVCIVVNGIVTIKKSGESYTYIRRIRPEHAVMRLTTPAF